MKRKLSDHKSKFRITVNCFSLTTKILKISHMINRRSCPKTNLHDVANCRGYIKKLVLSDAKSEPIILYLFKRREYIKLRDFDNQYDDEHHNYMCCYHYF